MPKEAKVFVVEDELMWQKRIADRLSRAKHQVVLTAKTRASALESVQNLRDLGVTVATIDGDLETVDAAGLDGEAVVVAIRVSAPEVKVIGVSMRDVAGVDVGVKKNEPDQFDKLGKIITRL